MIGLRKAVLLATGEQQLALGANFLVAVVTSRLMTPHEIGVAVIGTACVNLMTSVREYATASFLIKHADLSREKMNGALTGMLAFNLFLTVGLCLLAPFLAEHYADHRVGHFLQIVAIALFAEALAMPIVAVLRREMAIANAASIGIIGTLGMTFATIGLAALGWGYLSFAYGVFFGHVSLATAAILTRPRFWLFRPTFEGWRALFTFGSYNGTNAVLRQCYESVPYLVLGQILSFDSVAYYHRALMLSQLPGKLLLSGVEVLMLPALSAEARQGRELKTPLLRTFECVTVIYWPALIMLAIFAQPIVTTLYGHDWIMATPLVKIMVLAALFGFIGKLDASVFVAAGGLSDMLKRSLIVFPICALISSVSAAFGLYPLAWSYWISSPLQLFISLYFIQRHVPFTMQELMNTLSDSAVVTVLTCIGPLALVMVAGSANLTILNAVEGAVLAAIGWGLALRYSQHPMLAGFRRHGDSVTARP